MPRNSEASEVVKSHDELDPLEQSSELLGLSQTQLAEVLCNRTMQAPGEQVIRMSNTMQQAHRSKCSNMLGVGLPGDALDIAGHVGIGIWMESGE